MEGPAEKKVLGWAIQGWRLKNRKCVNLCALGASAVNRLMKVHWLFQSRTAYSAAARLAMAASRNTCANRERRRLRL